MIIDLMRHGEPVGGHRYRGQIDDPLSDCGWQQMRDAVKVMSGWQLIVTSPLRRCAEFAEELAQRDAIAVRVEPRFKEIGFGCWEGRTADELRRDDPQQFERFYQDPIKYPPPEAEGLTLFAERVTAAWRDLLQNHKDRHVLVVAHAGVIRAITAQVLGMPFENMYRLQISNAGVNRIQVDSGNAATLLLHNGRLA